MSDVAGGGGQAQIREEASAGGVSDLTPRAAAGAPMSGPVQRRSADVWGRAGDAASARRCSRAPTVDGDVRLSAPRPALLIGAGGGAARY